MLLDIPFCFVTSRTRFVMFSQLHSSFCVHPRPSRNDVHSWNLFCVHLNSEKKITHETGGHLEEQTKLSRRTTMCTSGHLQEFWESPHISSAHFLCYPADPIHCQLVPLWTKIESGEIQIAVTKSWWRRWVTEESFLYCSLHSITVFLAVTFFFVLVVLCQSAIFLTGLPPCSQPTSTNFRAHTLFTFLFSNQPLHFHS